MVSRRAQPQLNAALSNKGIDWEEEAAVELGAVCGDRVDFLACIRRPDVAIRCVSRALEADYQDLALASRRLALDPQQAPGKIEDEVVPSPFTHGPGDSDSQLDRLGGDRHFGDRSSLARRKHR
jgi:hypothetical protein